MGTLRTHISWTDSTWNPTTGCTKVSPGCDHCYAEALTNRLFGGGFDTVKLHAGRLDQVRAFTPIHDQGAAPRPRLVFVNSMSDLMHDQIPDAFRDRVFDAIETMPGTVFQVLTKRAMTLRRYAERRWRAGVPRNLWFGVSVEDNRAAGRIDTLRRMKDALGAFTAFLSVEPLIGPCDRHDYRGIDQVLCGGESGPRARGMEIAWPRTSRDRAERDGAAFWFKQFGTWANNPLYAAAPDRLHIDRVRTAIANGERGAWIETDQRGRPAIKGEKGGATLDGTMHRTLPAAYAALRRELAGAPSLAL